MAILTQHSPDLLCAEILADAKHQGEAIVGRAQAEAAAILTAAKTEAEKIRRERRDQAQAEAARRRELILATVAVETGRLRAARIESLLESIHAEIRRRLQAREADGRETIVTLAADAIRRMPANSFILEISAANQAVLDNGIAHDIAQRAGRAPLKLAISADGAVAGGGVIIRDEAGFQFWDNRLLSRLDRLWPELRRQIAMQTSLVAKNNSAGGES